jgi:multisubunit Na+/H+ antiporter MnhG subunit
MKTIIGAILIFFGTISFFRYPNFGRNLPESIGVLIGLAIIVVPGILLIRSDLKKSDNK